MLKLTTAYFNGGIFKLVDFADKNVPYRVSSSLGSFGVK
jgi:hypothetical protein